MVLKDDKVPAVKGEIRDGKLYTLEEGETIN